VTILDREEIQRGLRTLPERQRRLIQDRAAEQAKVVETRIPRLAADRFLDPWSDQEIDHMVTQCSDLPCPALEEDGSCGVYEFRPLACRSMGIPTEEAGLVQGACDIQTAIPLIRLSSALRREEDLLAQEEATQLRRLRDRLHTGGEEILLPFAFLSGEKV
jgi:Fe-S-cluster containining protein